MSIKSSPFNLLSLECYVSHISTKDKSTFYIVSESTALLCQKKTSAMTDIIWLWHTDKLFYMSIIFSPSSRNGRLFYVYTDKTTSTVLTTTLCYVTGDIVVLAILAKYI